MPAQIHRRLRYTPRFDTADLRVALKSQRGVRSLHKHRACQIRAIGQHQTPRFQAHGPTVGVPRRKPKRAIPGLGHAVTTGRGDRRLQIQRAPVHPNFTVTFHQKVRRVGETQAAAGHRPEIIGRAREPEAADGGVVGQRHRLTDGQRGEVRDIPRAGFRARRRRHHAALPVRVVGPVAPRDIRPDTGHRPRRKRAYGDERTTTPHHPFSMSFHVSFLLWQ